MATASREFQVLAKPIGAVCNLNCSYCYYLGKRDLYPGARSFRMPDDVLESYIVQHIEACPIDTVLFSWHGGEPTVLGIDFFRRVVELQRRHKRPGQSILNGIQTNGTLLDEEWCRFFASEGFHVGISIDGPRELHDRYRLFKGERATHRQVIQGYRTLIRHRVSCDVLCVVHNVNVRHPQAVYRFFKELGVVYLQFLPLVGKTETGEASAESVPPDAYGDFLCSIFGEWIRHDAGRICVQNFEEASRPFLGEDHALCIVSRTCGNIVVLEHNGDCYACDHFVDRRHLLGNIRETPLLEMLESPVLREFGERKRNTLPRSCMECEVLELCNGGCPKDRIGRTAAGESGLHYLCAGLKRFYASSRPMLQRLALAQRSGQPLEAFMRQLRNEQAPLPTGAGRNDRCPCGSGRKYKRCCLHTQPA